MKNILALSKHLDEDAAQAIVERLTLQAADMRARLESKGQKVAAPTVPDDLLEAVGTLSAHVADLAAKLGEESPVPVITAQLSTPAAPAPSPKAGVQTATDRCRAARAGGKSSFGIPPRQAGESLSAYCARINRGK